MHPGNAANPKLIVSFAQYLKKLKNDQWHNSFDNLPERTKPPTMFIPTMFLIWKVKEYFTQTFYTEPDPKCQTRGKENKRAKARCLTYPEGLKSLSGGAHFIHVDRLMRVAVGGR